MNPRVVLLKKTSKTWQLFVDDAPFHIKGVGCDREVGENGEDYLLMAREMGANAVRTWNIPTKTYLECASNYGLMVCAGVGLRPVRGQTDCSYLDSRFRKLLKAKILSYVQNAKDHPAILCWGLGNEVFAFSEKMEERKAFGPFLEELTQCVHAEDPNHPIVYASAASQDLPFLKEYVPSVDIVGLNVYESFANDLRWLRDHHYDPPVVVTEYGPKGAWAVPKDTNGQPDDALDQVKASDYAAIWQEIQESTGVCLGGFAFVLGRLRNQDSLTWFNINYGKLKREAYWVLYELYSRRQRPWPCPKISRFSVSPPNALRPGQTVHVSMEVDGDAPHVEVFLTNIVSDPVMVEPPKYYPAQVDFESPRNARLKAPSEPGTYRIYGLVADAHDNVAVANQSLSVNLNR